MALHRDERVLDLATKRGNSSAVVPIIGPASQPSALATLEPERLSQLWQDYWQARARPARNNLVLTYKHLVELVVTRLPMRVRTYWEHEDLVGFGCLGLLEAIERFAEDSLIGRFPAYATQRIRGAIFDELRRLDWLPRSVRDRVIAYRSAVDSLAGELGRLPKTSEVLKTMGLSDTDAPELLRDVQSAQLLHLQEAASDDEADSRRLRQLSENEEDEPELRLLAQERLAALRGAIERLPERQRTVIALRFVSGRSQDEIGNLLGVTNSRVCQIQASAIAELRRLLEVDETLTP